MTLAKRCALDVERIVERTASSSFVARCPADIHDAFPRFFAENQVIVIAERDMLPSTTTVAIRGQNFPRRKNVSLFQSLLLTHYGVLELH